MDLRKLKSLIELFESSGIGELEIAEGEERVRITRTYFASESASECTTTVLMPISRQARWMRSAISPRLAMSTLSNNWPAVLVATGRS